MEPMPAVVRRLFLALTIAMIATLLTPTISSAHVERPSYFPDPKPDCAVQPCAGGKIPSTRALASALNKKLPGNTRVVCQKDSMTRVSRAINNARRSGYNIRPTDHRSLSKAQGKALLDINRKLFKACKYKEIQPAIMASRNNDRVVVMPGLYLEPTARAKPTYDKSCASLHTPADSGDPGALSHNYQIKCPNDANLVAVIGRGPDTGPVPAPPLSDRHGIPAVGKCIRCNVQLEGSGVSADDVILEAGSAAAGNGGPSAVGHKKDVGIFVDRADGFVLRNMTIRHAREHDIYVLETDGYQLDRFKAYYAGAYGLLTFTSDHGLVQNCEASGHGDSGLYPGSGADTTTDRYKKFYPDYRYSQTFRLCDSHHNVGGFSGTNSSGTLVTQNNFYDNSLGYTTDVFTAPGHPNFPQHGNVVEKNSFYDNNFNSFASDSDVEPFIPAPVGTGLWLAGGNDNIVRNNHFFDNWRRGVMLFAVPDATVCGPEPVGSNTPVPGCSPLGVSTSYGNQFEGNTMGVSPKGAVKPNGVDFWWDSFPGNTGNCWYGNKGPNGARVTSSPILLPNCANGTNTALSIGIGNVFNELELVGCLVGMQIGDGDASHPATCNWAKTPPRPTGSSLPLTSAQAEAPAQGTLFTSICASDLAPRLCGILNGPLSTLGSLLSLGKPVATADRELPATPLPAALKATPLSTFTCSWWRNASDDQQVGVVQRIQSYATGAISGSTPYGFGAGMSDSRAVELFDSRCSTSHTGSYALYKLYGAAAPFLASAAR